MWRLIALSVATCVVMGGLMALLAPFVPNIYNTSEDVRRMATEFLYIVSFMMPFFAFTHACYFTLPLRRKDAYYDVFRLRLYLVRIVSGCVLPCEFYRYADHSAVPLRAVIGDYQMRNRIRSAEKGCLGTKHRSESGTAHGIMNKKGVSNANAT